MTVEFVLIVVSIQNMPNKCQSCWNYGKSIMYCIFKCGKVENKVNHVSVFDGTEDEYCVRCRKRNDVNNPICKNCGSTSFIYGFGLKPLETNGEGFRCQCGNEITLSHEIARGTNGKTYDTLYICDKCKRVFGTQIRIK